MTNRICPCAILALASQRAQHLAKHQHLLKAPSGSTYQ